MPRFVFLLVLTAAPLLAQTPTPSGHPKTPTATADDKLLDQIQAFQNRARQILKFELSRQMDPGCDLDKLSNAAFGNCFAADGGITERNYRVFVQALKASLAIQLSDVDPKIFPKASRNFAAGEVAWRTFVDKTCTALGDTYEGGSGTPTAETGCHQDLTRQHMKDLNEIFLKH